MGKRRDAAQIARDRKRIGNLYLKGWLQADIANDLDISQATVSRDLQALHQAWLDSALVDFNEAKAKELAKIDRLEWEYWLAWERSCEDAETVKQKGEPTPEPGKIKTSSYEKTIKGQAGDPRFLVGVQWCIERRCKILGIDAAQRHELTGADGKPIEHNLPVFEKMLERVYADDDGDGTTEGDDAA